MPRPKKSLLPRKTNQWWLLAGEGDRADLAHSIHAVVSQIEQRQALNKTHFNEAARFYLNRGDITGSMTANVMTSPMRQASMTWNVCKMCVDAIGSKIAKNKVRVFFSTSEGDPDQQERAMKSTQWMDHVFKRTKSHSKGQEAFRDATLYGTGVLQVSVDDESQILVDRVLYSDLRIDEAEAQDGEPEQMHRVRLISRDKLRALYPDEEDFILTAPKAEEEGSVTSVSERLKVIESWHLNTGLDDGWRVVSIEGLALEVAKYDFKSFPFVFTHWTKPLNGFLGYSLLSELIPIQIDINETISSIRESLRFSVARAWIDGETEIDENQLNDVIGSIVRYSGGQFPPTIQAPSVIQPEKTEYLKDQYAKAFEVSGISVMSATSKKQGGLESAAAIMEYMDIESERFALTSQAWETMFLDLADRILEISKKVYSAKSKIKLITTEGRFLEQAFWKDIHLPDDEVELEKYATPMLPKTPAGQIQLAVELAQYGVNSPEQTRAQLQFPDAQDSLRRANAPMRACQKIVNDVIAHGKLIPLTQYMPLDMLVKTATEAYLLAVVNPSTDKENLDKLERFMDQLATMLNPPAPPPMDAGAPLPPPDAGMVPPPNGAPPPPPPADMAAPPQM